MKTTNYLNLKKPEGTDFYNIEDNNSNMDTLDEKAKTVDEKIKSIEDKSDQDDRELLEINRKIDENAQGINSLNEEINLVKSDVQKVKNDVAAHYVKKTNLSVPLASWSASSYADWPFKASIAINGCTADHVCDVIFNLEQISMGIFAQFAETSAGEVTIFAEEKPDAAITIPVIELRK